MQIPSPKNAEKTQIPEKHRFKNFRPENGGSQERRCRKSKFIRLPFRERGYSRGGRKKNIDWRK